MASLVTADEPRAFAAKRELKLTILDAARSFSRDELRELGDEFHALARQGREPQPAIADGENVVLV